MTWILRIIAYFWLYSKVIINLNRVDHHLFNWSRISTTKPSHIRGHRLLSKKLLYGAWWFGQVIWKSAPNLASLKGFYLGTPREDLSYQVLKRVVVGFKPSIEIHIQYSLYLVYSAHRKLWSEFGEERKTITHSHKRERSQKVPN